MSSFKFRTHMQTVMQTEKIDQLEQEVHEPRGEVTTLQAEVEKLTSRECLAGMESSLMFISTTHLFK
jgi:cell division protein FtsL